MALSTIASLVGSSVTIIADWAGSSIVENLVSTAYSYLHDSMLPVHSEAELKRLHTALPQIKAVMGIAEALKMKHRGASPWVEQFRQALEASEDVLDELEYKRLEDMANNRDEAGGSGSNSKKRKLSSLNDDTLERLKEAVTMLDRATGGLQPLLQVAGALGIHDLSESWQRASEVLRRETTSFLVEREVFGRDAEKDKIITWLKQPTHDRLSSFGVVGMGGLGKTTLVQFAYQEMRGSNHFDKTIWICVSTNFSVEDITRKMLGELGESNCGDKPLNALQETLNEKILSKKVLLVLDDVWDDERRRDWEQLIAPLRFVQQGSKILFTTRMKSVADLLARVINTEQQSLALQGLGEQELRLLFYSYAFQGFNTDNYRDLQAFGDQILKMIRGSPLAARVIGSLLNSHMDYHYWRRILKYGSIFNLEIAKNVVEVLKLSYYHLPADLQVCFRFCSIFPKDHLFKKKDLIEMWIASGFIQQQSSHEERPEDIGEDYFNLLLRKSFFEYSNDNQYVIHDLMHELAQNVSYGECCRIETNDKFITIHSTVRHVYVHESQIEKVFHLENLRSLVITISGEEKTCTHLDFFVFPNNLIKKSLRLLRICGPKHCELPEEISRLVHLRYLSIERFKLHFLHSSVYKLYHLQVLEFQVIMIMSSYLGIETNRVSDLIRLRYMRIPKEIIQTISGIHKLTSLQELTFSVGKEVGYDINEISSLNNLRHLSIKNIENIGDPAEAKSANLLEKNNLMSLSLKWTLNSYPSNSEQIIDHLQPHPNLKKLKIRNYKGQRSPSWMEELSLLNLSSLKLLLCPVWKSQLVSWQMPYLKILEISHCASLDKLPDMPFSLIEFKIVNVGLTSLPKLYQSSDNNTSTPVSLKSSLRVVRIESCPNLISLDGFLEQDNLDLQTIEKLTIDDCEKLKLVPACAFGKFMSITDLIIKDCPMLAAIYNQSNLLPTKLKKLVIENCGELDVPLLESASRLTTLIDLWIIRCANITRIPSENAFESLNELRIFGCKNLVEHSSREQAHGINQGSNLASLKLELLDIDHLSLLLIEPMRSLRSVSLNVTFSRPKFVDCLEMEEFPEQWLLQNNNTLRNLVIHNAPLTSLPDIMARLTVLENFNIYSSNFLKHLPDLPTSLRVLHIWGTNSLMSLPATMARLTALEDLTIKNADLLEELPELPSSLRTLHIRGANSLISLPATMVRLTALEYLIIENADLLEDLPELPSSLRELIIRDEKSLMSLPATMVRLTVLEKLIIENVDLLEELPELPSSLRELIIRGAKSLMSLPSTMARLTALKYLIIENADLLEDLPELPPSLKKKYIQGSGGRLL